MSRHWLFWGPFPYFLVFSLRTVRNVKKDWQIDLVLPQFPQWPKLFLSLLLFVNPCCTSQYCVLQTSRFFNSMSWCWMSFGSLKKRNLRITVLLIIETRSNFSWLVYFWLATFLDLLRCTNCYLFKWTDLEWQFWLEMIWMMGIVQSFASLTFFLSVGNTERKWRLSSIHTNRCAFISNLLYIEANDV